MYLIYDVANYFNSITDLTGKKILDFGCNHANFLKYGFDGDYTGIDVDASIIQKNRLCYPKHKFIHYNRHNNQYNISNVKCPIPLEEKYDIICAFSVFTHTCYKEFFETIKELKSYLTDGGKILVTYIDISNKENLRLMFNFRYDILKNINVDDFLQDVNKFNTVSIVVDMEDLQTSIYYNQYKIEDFNKPTYFITMYNEEWLVDKIGGRVVDVTYNYNDIRAAQKCLIIE